MKSKLTYYITAQGMANMAERLRATQPRGIVTMRTGDPRLVKAVCPGTIVVYRHYFDNESYRAGKADGARWFTEMQPDIAATRGSVDYYMAINEPAIFNEQDARLLCEATKEWTRLMHAAGLKTLSYAFPEGHPELNLWKFLADGIGDGIILHEYDAPEMWRSMPGKSSAWRRLLRLLSRSPQPPLVWGAKWGLTELGWRCLRYRRVLNELRAAGADTSSLKIVIGETGIDGGVAGVNRPQQGWKAFGDIAHYMQSLAWYDKEICRDKQVLFAAIFAANWDVGNDTFNIENEDEIANHIAADHPEFKEDGAPVSKKLTDSEAARLYRAEGFADAVTALAIGIAESGLDPMAHNATPPDNSYGLMQINMIGALGVARRLHYGITNEQLYDPGTNLRVAFDISGGGRYWGAWSTFKNGRYKLYTDRATKALLGDSNDFTRAVLAEERMQPRLFNPDTAIYKDARAKGQGNPVTDEFSVGGEYVAQGYESVVKYVRRGSNAVTDVVRENG